MNLTLSKTTPKTPQERFQFDYKNYKWENSIICTNIRQNKLTPLYQPQDEKTGESKTLCPLCYYYYPKINFTTCCNQSICTECIAKYIEKPPNCVCPFCRKNGFQVTPNHVKEDEEDVEPEPSPSPLEGLPQEYVEIARLYMKYDDFIAELYKLKFTRDEIVLLIDSLNSVSPEFILDLAKEGMSAIEILSMFA